MGAIIVLAFFAYLLHSAQDMALQAKKTRPAAPPMGKMVDTETIGPQASASASDSNDEATTDIVNATRLPALLSAAQRYAKDHQGSLPPMDTPESLHAALSPRYVAGEGVFQSPRDGKAYLSNPALSGKTLASFPRPAEIIAFYEPLNSTGLEHEKSRAVVFLDGNLYQLKPSEWDVLRRKAGLR